MHPERARQILEEFQHLSVSYADPELAVVNTALMIEDVFGIRLDDADIGSDLLSSPEVLTGIIDRLQSRA